MDKIINRYKVDWHRSADKSAFEHFFDEAHRISALACDDMRKVVFLLNRRAAIIRAQREHLAIAKLDNDMLKIKLDMANASIAELEADNASLHTKFETAQENNAAIDAELSQRRIDIEEGGYALRMDKEKNILQSKLDYALSKNKELFSISMKSISDIWVLCSELTTCQADRDLARLEVAELKAERAGCREVCMGEVDPGFSQPDKHYGED